MSYAFGGQILGQPVKPEPALSSASLLFGTSMPSNNAFTEIGAPPNGQNGAARQFQPGLPMNNMLGARQNMPVGTLQFDQTKARTAGLMHTQPLKTEPVNNPQNSQRTAPPLQTEPQQPHFSATQPQLVKQESLLNAQQPHLHTQQLATQPLPQQQTSQQPHFSTQPQLVKQESLLNAQQPHFSAQPQLVKQESQLNAQQQTPLTQQSSQQQVHGRKRKMDEREQLDSFQTQTRLQCKADITAATQSNWTEPFKDINDAWNRLLPFHVFLSENVNVTEARSKLAVKAAECSKQADALMETFNRLKVKEHASHREEVLFIHRLNNAEIQKKIDATKRAEAIAQQQQLNEQARAQPQPQQIPQQQQTSQYQQQVQQTQQPQQTQQHYQHPQSPSQPQTPQQSLNYSTLQSPVNPVHKSEPQSTPSQGHVQYSSPSQSYPLGQVQGQVIAHQPFQSPPTSFSSAIDPSNIHNLSRQSLSNPSMMPPTAAIDPSNLQFQRQTSVPSLGIPSMGGSGIPGMGGQQSVGLTGLGTGQTSVPSVPVSAPHLVTPASKFVLSRPQGPGHTVPNTTPITVPGIQSSQHPTQNFWTKIQSNAQTPVQQPQHAQQPQSQQVHSFLQPSQFQSVQQQPLTVASLLSTTPQSQYVQQQSSFQQNQQQSQQHLGTQKSAYQLLNNHPQSQLQTPPPTQMQMTQQSQLYQQSSPQLYQQASQFQTQQGQPHQQMQYVHSTAQQQQASQQALQQQQAALSIAHSQQQGMNSRGPMLLQNRYLPPSQQQTGITSQQLLQSPPSQVNTFGSSHNTNLFQTSHRTH